MTDTDQKNIRILIVDDSIINLEIASDFIEDLGFSYDTASNGEQALDAVKNNSFSLVFMDIHMPVMNGLAVSEAIRKYERSAGIDPVPIVALTSDTSSGIKKRCFESGLNDYLKKPFTQHEMLVKITENINFDLLSNNNVSREHSPAVSGRYDKALLDAVEDIAQVSHWFWHISDQRIQFSKYLQHHFDFPLHKIASLDEYIKKVGSKVMDTVINECISTEKETSWEQVITEPGCEQPKYLLHKFRYVICEDHNPVLIGTIQDISSIRYAEQQALELASYDTITGLSSRFRFNQQLEDLIKYSHRHSKKFALLYLNLESYKTINESHGHDTADSLLVEIARRLNEILRKSDFACRLIDDEFCLAIKDITDDHIPLKVAKRYLELFQGPIHLVNKTITPDANIGLAIYPQDGIRATDLIKAANTASVKAKHLGDHHCAFYESAMTDAAHNHILKEKELKTALSENQFEMYYQPKISLITGKVDGVEALIRWNNPDNKLHLPESFLPDAESMGMMTDIGNWTILQVCNQINEWKKQGLNDIPVSVNISKQHFEQHDFVDSIVEIAESKNVSPSQIEIEITESITRNESIFMETCDKLRSHGFTTAIDDFGTGYSSLSALKKIPVDALKIDDEFIRNLPNDTQSSIIIGTILGISNALGLQVIAEGAETTEQVTTLTGMGVHSAQGYYFSQPVTADEIPSFAKRNFRKPSIYRVA